MSFFISAIEAPDAKHKGFKSTPSSSVLISSEFGWLWIIESIQISSTKNQREKNSFHNTSILRCHRPSLSSASPAFPKYEVSSSFKSTFFKKLFNVHIINLSNDSNSWNSIFLIAFVYLFLSINTYIEAEDLIFVLLSF